MHPRTAFLLFASGCSVHQNASVTESANDRVLEVETEGNPEPIDVSDRVAAVRAEFGVPALSIALIHDDHITHWGADGERAMGGGIPVTLDDQWHIGSNTKSITAFLVAVLIDEGVLRWDTTVAEVFAEDTPAEGWENVSILELLRHRSGLAELGQQERLFMYGTTDTPATTRALWVERVVLRESPDPSKDYLYTNAGYMLAGAMLERLTGETWETLMQRHVFDILGMPDAGFGVPDPDQPLGHRQTPDGTWSAVPPGPMADNPPALGPAGTVHTNHASWTPYLATHLDIAREEEGPFENDVYRVLHQLPEGGSYAGGWVISDDLAGTGIPGPILAHQGSNTLWLSTVFLLPSQNAAFVCNTNAFFNESTEGCVRLLTELLGPPTESDSEND